jgi:hypothetical protein
VFGNRIISSFAAHGLPFISMGLPEEKSVTCPEDLNGLKVRIMEDTNGASPAMLLLVTDNVTIRVLMEVILRVSFLKK